MGKKRKDGRSTMTVSRSTTAIIHGEDDLSGWSEEELVRGQRRNNHGRWPGGKPLVVPKALHNELVRRRLSKAFNLLRDNLVAAVSVLIEVAKDKDADAHARIKAAQTIMHYVAGKPPERVMFGVTAEPEPLWMQAIKGSIIGVVPGTQEPTVVDAEIVEDDIEWEDEPAAPKSPPGDPRDSHEEQELDFGDVPRTRPWGSAPKQASSVAERREGRA